MRREYFIAGVGVVCLLISVPIVAEEAKLSAASAVPRLVRYSGVVKEVAGKPLQGAMEVSFSLYEEQEGGSAIWSERQAVEADALGRYAVLLGATQAEGLPAEIFASGKARWLEVEVQGLSPQPRVLLVSVPYAMKAEDAERLGGKKATDFVLAEQLKDEVKTAVSLGVVPVEKSASGRTTQAALTSPTGTSPAITGGASSFACTTTTPCVTVSQSSTGIGTQSAAKTLGLYGLATQTTGTTYGVQGRTASTAGRGAFGYATAGTGGTIGAYGLALSTSGVGVYGDTTAKTGATRGVIGRTYSPSGIGVYGQAAPTTGGIGVLGQATATTGVTYGVYGQALSPSGTGVVGYATATSGATTGVLAKVFSVDGMAIVAHNTAGGKIFSGGDGTYENIRIYGYGDIYGPYASFWNGVYGGGYYWYGVDGANYSDTGTAVHGQAYGSGDGVFGESVDGNGVRGASSNGTGVYGTTSSSGGSGLSGVVGGDAATGVLGINTNSGGNLNWGVKGIVYATDANAVEGNALSTTGPSYGVLGTSQADEGIGVAAYADSQTGETTGVFARVLSPDGVAGKFYVETTANILLGEAGPYPGSAVFRVDSTGKGFFNGGTQTGGADFAESFAVAGERAGYEPGDVLVIDSTGNRRVALSSQPYSTAVAGIFSTKPGVLATPFEMDDRRLTKEIPLAVVGIVPCKVSAENGPIERGDLLVTSSMPGVAMKGTDRTRMLGAVVGKALGQLHSGSGVIEVLVTLQ